MASLIYGVSNSNREGLGYSEPYENHKNLNEKPKALYEQFVPFGTHVRSSEPTHSEGSRRQPQKRNKTSMTKPHAQIPLKYSAAQSPKVPRTSGKKTNKRGPRKWYQRTKLSFLQIFLTAPMRHQSWYLDSRCWQHMKGERHMFQELELNAAGA